MVAFFAVGGEDINRWMVKRGHAIAHRKYSSNYVPSEDRERAAERGMWAGHHQAPWAARHQHAKASVQHRRNSTAHADDCD